MTVTHMLRSMPSSEFAEWGEMYKLDPWGEERADLRAGVVASTVANVNRSKSGRTYKASDFALSFSTDAKSKDTSQRMSVDQTAKYMLYLEQSFRARQRKRSRDRGGD